MFVHLVTEVWVSSDPEGGSSDDPLAVFASLADAETYVWSMEEKAPENWAVKAGMGTLHYFVMTMPMIEENAKVEDYA